MEHVIYQFDDDLRCYCFRIQIFVSYCFKYLSRIQLIVRLVDMYRTNPYWRRYDRTLAIKEQAVATTVTQNMILTTTVCYCGAAIIYVLQANV